MKIKTSDLTEALTRLKPIISRRTTLPILSCVKLHTERNRLHLTVSDLDQYQVERIECDGEFEPCCINFNYLLNALGGEAVSLKRNKTSVDVRCDFGVTELDVLEAEEFPPPPKCDGLKPIGVSCEDLSKAINSVAWAASTDETRWILNSVHVAGSSKRLEVVSTDGRQMARIEQPLISSDFEILIPSAFASSVAEVLARKGSELSANGDHIKISHENGNYYAKQVDGKFPNYKQVIPVKQEKIGDFEVGPFREMLGRCKFYADYARSLAAQIAFGKSGAEIEFVGKASNLNLVAPGEFKSFNAVVDAETFHRCLSNLQAERATIFKDASEDKFPMIIMQAGDLFIYTTQVTKEFQKKAKEA